MIVNIIVFTAGLFLLIYGSDILIQSSVKFSFLLRLTPLFIGLIVVAFGTSAPEFAVSLIATIKHQKAIALGNIIGSDITNIALVLGVCSLIKPLDVNRKVFKGELPVMVFSAALVYALSLDMVISRVDGLILIASFVVFCLISFKNARLLPEEYQQGVSTFRFNKVIKRIKSVFIISIFIIFSLFLVLWGACLMVKSGVKTAHTFGISPWVISITIFALGTSLPELAASMTASLKKASGVSIGNIIGSNTINILLVLGVVSIIRPITIDDPSILTFEMPVLLALSIALFVFMRTSFKISRAEGLILLISYIVFIILVIEK